jgi:hypothetical protein
MRGLTEAELDKLQRYLLRVDKALRRYDEAAAPLLAAIDDLDDLGDPWWAELRPELLRRGKTAQFLDDCCGSCAGTESEFSDGPPIWLPPLLTDVVRRVDPAPFATAIADLIRLAGSIKTEKLVTALRFLRSFHPIGMPHQVMLSPKAFGMRPIAQTEDGGGVVYGYGPGEGLAWPKGVNPEELIWERRTKDPAESEWLRIYEGLLSWIGEVIELLHERAAVVIGRREEILNLEHELAFLAGIEGAPEPLPALAAQAFVLSRLLLGLVEEIARERRHLTDELGALLGAYSARWRKKPEPYIGLSLGRHLRFEFRPPIGEWTAASY